MKYLIITVAGTASRFNKDTEKETLKCLYYKDSPRFTLLNQLLENCGPYDKYIIVGGYLYAALTEYVKEHLKSYGDKISLVYNEHFRDYGSCYSLYKGLMAMEEPGEATFVEGDLFFRKEEFQKVFHSKKSVLTINREPIYASKAVALYIGLDGRPHYLYDTKHSALTIPEPFVAIFNSAQIWKFHAPNKLEAALSSLKEEQLKGTNLEIVQAYFDRLSADEYEVAAFSEWYNCNTVADYNIVRSLMKS